MKYDFDIITIGGATEDLFFTVDDYVMINNRQDILRKKLLAFEYGAKIGVTDISSAFGGGAANTAVAAARLGLKTGIIAYVGNDLRGSTIMTNFKTNKVNTRLVQKDTKSQSGLSFILVSPKHDHIVFTYRGANTRLTIGRKESLALSRSRWTYVTSLTGAWQKTLKNIFDSSNNIVWNPGRKQLAAGFTPLRNYLKKCNVFICNKDEALELVISHPNIGQDNNRALNNTRYLLETIQGFGCGIVIITNGGHGADAYDGSKFYYQKALPAKVSDTTGVGDAFGASFIAGLDRYKGDIKRSLAIAAKNAASVISSPGAQFGLLNKKKLGL